MTDSERLRVLTKSQLLDSPSEEAFDRFTKLASLILDTPVSLVALVDKDRQYFKSYIGVPEPWASRQQVPLSHSLCQYVVSSRKPLIVKDAREEDLLKNNLAISDLGIIAYLGFPLIVEDQALGSFCVSDSKPRVWSEREIRIVQEIAHFVTTEIAFRIEAAERQKAEQQLRASEERFRTLAHQAPIMIWQTDISGACTFNNTTWCTFTGLPEQKSLGLDWISVIHPDDRAEALALWRKVLPERLPYHIEFRVRRADGVYREVISHGSVYTDQSGTFLGYIGTVIDITEQKELDRQREAFMNMITHDLKSPLTATQGNIQLAQRRLKSLLSNVSALNSQQQTTISQAINTLARGVANLQDQTRMINDLLDLSRSQLGKLEFRLVPCDLVTLVQQTLQDQQATCPQRDIIFALPDDVPLMVLADVQRTRQVLSNYLTNAVKYSPPEQPVQVGISADTASARVWVQDHGLGLTQEQQAHIWESFYQLHEIPAYIKGTPNLGLGLHICQALIHGQQGEVGVESTKGDGATFWFTLPLIRSSENLDI
jgi:PAS domain S-box-containing protein